MPYINQNFHHRKDIFSKINFATFFPQNNNDAIDIKEITEKQQRYRM